jgi:hypothetical protein
MTIGAGLGLVHPGGVASKETGALVIRVEWNEGVIAFDMIG